MPPSSWTPRSRHGPIHRLGFGAMSPSRLDDRFQTLHEIVRAAKLALAPGPWDYLAGGTETETTLRRNRQALDSIAFRPRVLRNVSKIDSTSTLFGRKVRIPVMIAPVGSVETFEPGGGATAAKASAEFEVPQMLSSVCNPGLEAVAAAADNFRIFQLYVRGDDAWVDEHVKRAQDNRYAAFCLTVHTAMSRRRRAGRSRPRVRAPGRRNPDLPRPPGRQSPLRARLVLSPPGRTGPAGARDQRVSPPGRGRLLTLRRRVLVLAVLLYLTADYCDPLVPGVFWFDTESSFVASN